MSYSRNIGPIPLTSATALTVDDLIGDTPAPVDEVLDHYRAVAAAIPGLVAALGPDLGGGVHVTVSGHAEPGHGYRPGWSTDVITVSVSKCRPPASPAG